MNKRLISIFLALGVFISSPSTAAEESSDSQNLYYRIQEPFTINFLSQSEQKVRYLQIKVALKSDDSVVLNSAQHNLPMIQDALRTLFTNQSYESVSNVEGREKLQQEALSRVRAILKQETGNDGLEQIYFTSFILQ
ncbi:flagellar basal body-associated FliL family protein [Methylophaga sp.]|uniref:flagellar basal body-associated FliL family protein n=1 Tax=Methylophaga sp. TaxID=2024840 RepID=UPI003F69D0FE